MLFNLSDLKPAQVYHTMTQTLIPRPIAWVMSENAVGGLNLAPFSYFTAISSNPPLVLFSVGKKPDGSPKDTRVNIELRRDFVLHIATRSQLQALNNSSATLQPEVSEVERLGLETTALDGCRLPRLKQAPIAYGCRRHQIIDIGATPQALIIGEATTLYVADDVAEQDPKGRLRVRADRLDPIARLGACEYAMLGDIVRLPRPS